jgi:GTP-binding protein
VRVNCPYSIQKLSLVSSTNSGISLFYPPSVSLSTLLEALTASKPRIAAHKFTTLNPYVGVCRILDDGTIVSSPSATASSVPLTTPEQAVHFDKPILPTQSYAVRESLPDTTRHKRSLFGQRNRVSHEDEALRFRICDNPGLIPESHLNKGLGHHFLLSVSRSPILCLVLDFTLPLARLIEQAEMIVKELDHFEPESKLRERIRIVVGNKADEVKDEVKGRKRREGLSRWVRRNLGPKEKRSEEEDGEVTTHGRQEVEVKLISGKWGLGIRDLAFTMGEMVVERREKEAFEREERRRKVREEEEEIVRELQKKILKFTDVPPRGLGEEDVGFGLLAPPRDMMEGVEFVGGQGKKKVGGNQEDGVESGEEEEEGEGERNRTEDGKGEEKT